MKSSFYERIHQLANVTLVVFLFAIIILNVVECVFHFRNQKVLSVLAQVNQYQVRSELLMDAMQQVGVCNAQAAVDVWANGLIKRSAAMQYSVMNEKLKKQYTKQLEKSAPNWVTGQSSPWVQAYIITNVQKTKENNYIVDLEISTATSTGPAGTYDANLTIEKIDQFWQISKLSFEDELYVYTGFKPEN